MLDKFLIDVSPPKREIEIAIFKEEDQFIAYLPALDIAAHGDTDVEAMNNLKEVFTITLEFAKQYNTVVELLLSNGWTLTLVPKPIYRPPAFSLRSIKSKFNISSIQSRQSFELAF